MCQLIELDEPVEDQMGFVYEGAAIRADINGQHNKQLQCPVAGASHVLTLQSLKPCRRILRQQKARQKQHGAGQQGHTQHPGGAAGRVLDI